MNEQEFFGRADSEVELENRREIIKAEQRRIESLFSRVLNTSDGQEMMEIVGKEIGGSETDLHRPVDANQTIAKDGMRRLHNWMLELARRGAR